MPDTVCRAGHATIPDINVTNVRKVGAVKHDRNVHRRAAHEPGKISNWSINETFAKGTFVDAPFAALRPNTATADTQSDT